MSDFSVIEAISGELRRQIFEVLQATPGADFGIGGSLEKISVLSPGAKLPDGTLASLYLYHIEIDGHLRNQRMLADRMADDLYRMPPLPLKLRLLLTPVDADEGTNQMILGRLIQHFNDNPTVAVLSGTPLGDSFGGAPTRLRVTVVTPALEQMMSLWTAFATALRVSVVLEVQIVGVDSGKPPQRVTRVETLVPAYGQTGGAG